MAFASDVTRRSGGCVCSYVKNNKTALLITAQVLPIFLSVTLLQQLVLLRLFPIYTLEFHPVPLYLPYAFYPISISLVTNFFRRYSVIRGSLWVTFVAVIGTVVVLLLDYSSVAEADIAALLNPTNAPLLSYIKVLLALAYVLLSLGLAGFHSNVIAFGYEQMESAAANELVTLIHLCLGLEYLGFGVAALFPAIIPYATVINLYVSLGCATMVTTVMVIIILCRHHMVIEEPPNTPNPLKLILRVAWYSRKVHSSHQITATAQDVSATCTLAVMPFTTKEVSDVRAFLRLLPAFIPLGLIMAAHVASTRTAPLFSNVGDGASTYLLVGSYSIPYLVVPFAILLHRVLCVDAFCMRYAARILNRVCFGALLMALAMVVAMTAYGLGLDSVEFYMTLNGLSGVSMFLVVSAVFEFICAQSPYSMRSMMISISYATEGLGSIVGIALFVGILEPFGVSFSKGRTRHIVYYSVSTALTVVALAIAVFNAKTHKTRRRLDKKYEDAYADNVSILSSMTSSIEIVSDVSLHLST